MWVCCQLSLNVSSVCVCVQTELMCISVYVNYEAGG